MTCQHVESPYIFQILVPLHSLVIFESNNALLACAERTEINGASARIVSHLGPGGISDRDEVLLGHCLDDGFLRRVGITLV